MKRLLQFMGIGFGALLVLAGCQWTVTNANTATSSPVSFTTLSTTGLAVTNHRLEIIRDTTTWQQLWSTYAPGTTPPTVDFTQQTVLAAFRGTSPNSGYGIAIQAVDNLGTTTGGSTLFQVTVGLSEPQSGVAYTQVITYPAHVVVLNQVLTGTEVIWREGML